MTDIVLRDIDPVLADRIRRIGRGARLEHAATRCCTCSSTGCTPARAIGARALADARGRRAGGGDRGDGTGAERPGLRADRTRRTAPRRSAGRSQTQSIDLDFAASGVDCRRSRAQRRDRSRRARAARARRSPPAGCRGGRPASRRASQAKPIASTKSGSTPCAAVDSTATPGRRAAMRASSPGCARRRRRPARARVSGWCARSASATVARGEFQQRRLHVLRRARRRRAAAPAASRDGTVRGRCSSAAAARTRVRRAARASSAASMRPLAAKAPSASNGRAGDGARTRHPSTRWPGRCRSRARRPARGSKRQVGDAAEIEHRAVFVRAMQQRGVQAPAAAARHGRRRRHRGGGNRRRWRCRCVRR